MANSDCQSLAEISYRKQLVTLIESEIPFLVGGAYALDAYLGLSRDRKDFDLFVLPQDMPRVLEVLAAAGYRTEIVASHWLAKVHSKDGVTDVIFNSGNGLCRVDAHWFEHAPTCEIFDLRLHLCPPEETLWQKAFIMERERYDGADVAHLLRSCGPTLDWQRLLARFGDHWPVLLSHLVLFSYIFPSQRLSIPDWVMEGLLDRARSEMAAKVTGPAWCRGTLLAARQYAIDIHQWGYKDPRLPPEGQMLPEQIARWEAWLQDETTR